MKKTIDGEPAYLVAKKNKISPYVFYKRVKRGWAIETAATKRTLNKKYVIKQDEETKYVCFSAEQVAKYLRTTKGTICGLFYRHGNKISLFGYTVERRVRRENKKDSNL